MENESGSWQFIEVTLLDLNWFRELPRGSLFALIDAQRRIEEQEIAQTRHERATVERKHPWDQEMAEAFGWPPIEDDSEEE